MSLKKSKKRIIHSMILLTDNLETASDEIVRILSPLSEKPVILCIGSDRVIYDSLGPLTGEYLTRVYQTPAFVYGTLYKTVNALNLSSVLAHIKLKHMGAKIIAVDASLGKSYDIGKLGIIEGGIFAGSAANKKLPRCGDVGVTATVAEFGKKTANFVRLGAVNALADITARTIDRAVSILREAHPDKDKLNLPLYNII